MSTSENPAPEDTNRELVLTRLIDAPRDKVWRCWTEADLLMQWYAPRPWSTPSAALDVRPGGVNAITMRNPEGEDFPSTGVYLEVVPNEKLVFTDSFTDAWTPAEKPFFTAILTFEDEDGKTRYTARALHWPGGGLRSARADGLPRGLGSMRRPARGTGEDAVESRLLETTSTACRFSQLRTSVPLLQPVAVKDREDTRNVPIMFL